MFEVGFQELVMIALLALIVLGPEKLPKLAAKIGNWTGRARVMARNLRSQLEQEVSYEDLKKQKEAAEEALRKAQEAPMQFHDEVQSALDAVKPGVVNLDGGATAEATSAQAAITDAPVNPNDTVAAVSPEPVAVTEPAAKPVAEPSHT